MAAGLTGFILWLLIPWFWVGMILAVLSTASAAGGYTFYRNERVGAADRWDLSWAALRRVVPLNPPSSVRTTPQVTLYGALDEPLARPSTSDPQASAHDVLEELLLFALPRAADRIEMIAHPDRSRIAVHVDGVRYAWPSTTATMVGALIDYLKKSASLDVSDRRRRLVGRLDVQSDEGKRHALAITTFGSTRELTMQLEIDPDQFLGLEFQDLGLRPQQIEHLDAALARRHGVVLVASPSGHGQTTTLYGLLGRHDPYRDSIVTLEHRVVSEIEGVSHNVIRPGLTATRWQTASRRSFNRLPKW